MNIEELTIKQVERVICSEATTADQANSIAESLLRSPLVAALLATLPRREQVLFLTGISYGFALRDIAAVDEALASVERATT